MFENEAIERIFEVLKPSIKRAFEYTEQRGGILDTTAYFQLIRLISELENKDTDKIEVIVKPGFRTVGVKITSEVLIWKDRRKSVFCELIMKASAISILPRTDGKVDMYITFKDMFLKEGQDDAEKSGERRVP